jgi:uncharacterized protein YjbI with pentapeptide repeats
VCLIVPAGALTTTVVVLLGTLIVAAVFLLAGFLLIFGRWRPFGDDKQSTDIQRDLGMALVPGAIFGLAVFALQLYLDLNNQRVQNQRDREARHETVQLAIATTQDLSGFDPRGEPLSGVYLAGKVLDGARFEDADLRDAVLRDTSLQGAELSDAQLQRAELINADLFEAVLTDANLAGAELRAAKFEGASLYGVESLEGAIVDARTCWPARLFGTARWRQLVKTLNPEAATTASGEELPPSPGHACREGEHQNAEATD